MVQPPVKRQDREVGMDLGTEDTRIPVQPAEEAKGVVEEEVGKVVEVAKAAEAEKVGKVGKEVKEAKAAMCVGTGRKDIVGEIQGSAGFHMAKKRVEERRFAGTSQGATAHEARTAGSLTREKPQLVHKERAEDQAAVQPKAPRQQHRVPQRYERQRWSPHTPHGDGQARSEA